MTRKFISSIKSVVGNQYRRLSGNSSDIENISAKWNATHDSFVRDSMGFKQDKTRGELFINPVHRDDYLKLKSFEKKIREQKASDKISNAVIKDGKILEEIVNPIKKFRIVDDTGVHGQICHV